MIEVSSERFERKKYENDSNLLPNVPIKFCVVAEWDECPYYCEVVRAWISRSLREGEDVSKSEMERLDLEGFYVAKDPEPGSI